MVLILLSSEVFIFITDVYYVSNVFIYRSDGVPGGEGHFRPVLKPSQEEELPIYLFDQLLTSLSTFLVRQNLNLPV